MKRTSIRRVSQKRWAQIPERQELRQIQLVGAPNCEAKIEGVCEIHATDVHELINRSQMRNSWLTPELFVSLCRPCHHFVTVYPLWAKKHGYTLSSWQYAPFNIEKAQRIRGKCRDKTCTKDHMELLSGD